jgi:Predicted membrane protein (DUF2142)
MIRQGRIFATPLGSGTSRPRFLPAQRWALVALVLLLTFTMARGALWAVTTPTFWGPDEDYHFLYIEKLTVDHELPSNKEPLYPAEYTFASQLTQYDSYGGGPRPDFTGDPKESTYVLTDLPERDREGRDVGRGVGIVHPPLYHVLGAAVNSAAGDASILTRVTWVRLMTALLGVLAVYAAWLLGAQVFRRPALPILVGLLVAVQPMVSFLAGIVNHDTLLIALYTLALAQMAYMLAEPPSRRQGLWLGLWIALAMLVKSSALGLIPLAGLTLLLQALVHRRRWRETARAGGLGIAVIALVAAWWYVRARIVYGSFTGAIASPFVAKAQYPDWGAADLVQWAREWTGLTYRTYWFHYHDFEAPRGSKLFYLPAFIGGIGMLGLVGLAFQRGRELLNPVRADIRQGLVLVAAVLAVYLPIMGVDLIRRTHGDPFYVNGGRYLLPAYGAAVCLLLIGLRWLTTPRARPVVFTTLGAVACWFLWEVWQGNYLGRYFGPASLGETFRRMSFDRPAFVTRSSLMVLLVVALVSLACVAIVTLAGDRGWRLPSQLPRPRRRALSRSS